MQAWSYAERRTEAIRTSRTAPVTAPPVAGVRLLPPPPPPPPPSPPEPPIARSITGTTVDCPSMDRLLRFFSVASFQFCFAVLLLLRLREGERVCVWELEIPSLRGLFQRHLWFTMRPHIEFIYPKTSSLSFGFPRASSRSFVAGLQQWRLVERTHFIYNCLWQLIYMVRSMSGVRKNR
jgi:hypothetical protein